MKTETEFKRNCPECGKITYYTSLRGQKLAEENKSLCANCHTSKSGREREEVNKNTYKKHFDIIKQKYFRKCPDCNIRVYFSDRTGLIDAIENDRRCKKCAASERNKPVYEARMENYSENYDEVSEKWFRLCPSCDEKIYYVNFHSFDHCVVDSECRSCIAKNNCNTTNFIEQARAYIFSENGLATKNKKKRTERKLKLGLDPTTLFLERVCPQCKIAKITYKAEKSALQAEEKGNLCHVCINRNMWDDPNSTFNSPEHQALLLEQCHKFRENNSRAITKGETELYNHIKNLGFIHCKMKYRVDRFYPDIIHEKYKIIVEFYGDRYHANPIVPQYVDNDVSIKFPDGRVKIAKDIREYDAERKRILENEGYIVLIVWEKDFHKKKTKPLIYDAIKNVVQQFTS